MSRIPITRGGYEKLKAELDKLRNVDRNEVILAIQTDLTRTRSVVGL